MNNDYGLTQLKQRLELEKQLPIEFCQYFSYMAYERGHSAGEEEVNGIFCGMVEEFIPVLKEYNKRVGLIK